MQRCWTPSHRPGQLENWDEGDEGVEKAASACRVGVQPWGRATVLGPATRCSPNKHPRQSNGCWRPQPLLEGLTRCGVLLRVSGEGPKGATGAAVGSSGAEPKPAGT